MASFRQLESGRWQVQVRRQGHPPAAKTFGSRTDAARWARSLETEIDQGVFVDRAEVQRATVGELIDRYLVEVTPRKRSARQEAQRLRVLRSAFGHYSLAILRNVHIAAYRDQRLASGASGATVVKDLCSLSHVIDVAIKDWGLAIAQNPAKLVRKPAVARGRDRRFQHDEEARVLEACRQSRAPMLLPVVRLALETGMRMGEILSLHWKHVDLGKRIATLPITKNGETRQVPLSSAAASTLAALPRHMQDGRVFWTWARTDSLDNAWRRALASSGVEDFRFHDLRHEAVSRLFEHGLNPMEVAAISGHKTLQMLKRYTHLKAADLVRKLA
jgi:integrase